MSYAPPRSEFTDRPSRERTLPAVSRRLMTAIGMMFLFAHEMIGVTAAAAGGLPVEARNSQLIASVVRSITARTGDRIVIFVPQYPVQLRALRRAISSGKSAHEAVDLLARAVDGTATAGAESVIVVVPQYTAANSGQVLAAEAKKLANDRRCLSPILAAWRSVPVPLRARLVAERLTFAQLPRRTRQIWHETELSRNSNLTFIVFGDDPPPENASIAFVPTLRVRIFLGRYDIAAADFWDRPVRWKRSVPLAMALQSIEVAPAHTAPEQVSSTATLSIDHEVLRVQDVAAIVRRASRSELPKLDPSVADRLLIVSPGRYRVDDLIRAVVAAAQLNSSGHEWAPDLDISSRSLYLAADPGTISAWAGLSRYLLKTPKAAEMADPFMITDFTTFRTIRFPMLDTAQKHIVQSALNSLGIVFTAAEIGGIYVRCRMGVEIATYVGDHQVSGISEESSLYSDQVMLPGTGP